MSGPPPPRAVRALADADSRFAQVDGVHVHHKVTGDPDAPAVVLLHHFYGNVATWRHLHRELSSDHRVIAFDRPGFGLTEPPPRRHWNGVNPYTRAASARLALGLLDHLGIEAAALVGSSAGGTIALETYALAPGRVHGLGLLAPAITGDVGPPPHLRRWMRRAPLRALGPAVVRRVAGDITRERVSRSWADPGLATDDDVEAYARPLRVTGWARGYWELFAAEPPPDLRGLLPRVEVPTLVVSGDTDRVVSPALSRRTAAAIPGASYVELPRTGHTPHEERPDALAAVLRPFLADLGR